MSDEIPARALSMRLNAQECIGDYQELVAKGEALTSRDDTVADFPTVYMTSRLVHNGYADAFAQADYWDIPWFADHIREHIEDEIVNSTQLPDGQFALDLAFLMLSQVEWTAVAQVLSEVIAQQQEAMLRLKGKDVPEIESRPMSPQEWRKLTGQGFRCRLQQTITLKGVHRVRFSSPKGQRPTWC
jgi:hypothetical protein